MEMGITELMLRISKLHPFLLQGQLDNHVWIYSQNFSEEFSQPYKLHIF